MAAIMTESGHVNRAINFLNTESIFVGIGQQSMWTNENVPPEPTGDETTLTEVIGYKKIFNKRLVRPHETGNIRYKGQNWEEVSKLDAFTKGSKWVMLEVFLEYDELPVDVSYRQVGVFTGLKPKTAHAALTALLPIQVENQGILEIIDNRKVENRDVDKKEGIIVIVQF